MNEPMDRVFADWLREGPESGPGAGLTGALATTRRTGQRAGWTFPERWLPVQLTMIRTRSQRPVPLFLALALLIVAFVAATVYVGSQRHQAPVPLFRNGAVVYEQGGDLFIADGLDGTPRALVAHRGDDSGPVFSNQGNQIAFVREGSDAALIMAVRPDGTNLEQLARVPQGIVRDLRWSPDDRALIASCGLIGNSFIGRIVCVMRSDGSELKTLDIGPASYAASLSWRPDGRQMAFFGDDSTGAHLFIADADGTDIRPLPIGPVASYDGLEWSPDGTQLAFAREEVHDAGVRISIADVDEDGTVSGSRLLALDPEATEAGPLWSPDGRLLAFTVRMDATFHVGIAMPDGSDYRSVGPDMPLGGGRLAYIWAPDGRSLVISRIPTDDRETTWSVDVATGEQTEVGTPVESWQRLAP